MTGRPSAFVAGGRPIIVGPRVAIVTRCDGPTTLQELLDVTHAINVSWLQRHPEAPRLYESGIRYRREPRGGIDTAENEERFLTWPSLLVARVGDCDDLAPALSAELVVCDGIPARPLAVRVRRGYHVVVILPDGTILDPSRDLGMGAE